MDQGRLICLKTNPEILFVLTVETDITLHGGFNATSTSDWRLYAMQIAPGINALGQP